MLKSRTILLKKSACDNWHISGF